MPKPIHPHPTPKVVRVVCELCDEEWGAHGESPTTLDCIRLLKLKRQWTWYPYVNTGGAYVYPYTTTINSNVSYRRPEVA